MASLNRLDLETRLQNAKLIQQDAQIRLAENPNGPRDPEGRSPEAKAAYWQGCCDCLEALLAELKAREDTP